MYIFKLLSLYSLYRTLQLWKYVVLDSLTFLITKKLTAEQNIMFVLQAMELRSTAEFEIPWTQRL